MLIGGLLSWAALTLIGCGDDATAGDSTETTDADSPQSVDIQFRPVLERLPPGSPVDDESTFEGVPEPGGTVLVYRLGPSMADGSTIESATAIQGGQGGTQWVLKPLFKAGADGIDQFNAAADLCNARAPECPTGILAIVIDDVVISAPSINATGFERDSIEISGDMSRTDVDALAEAINGN